MENEFGSSRQKTLSLLFSHSFNLRQSQLLYLERQLLNCRRVEQRAQSQFNAEGAANLCDELSTQQRVSAEQEKIVVNADLVQFQERANNQCQARFNRSARGSKRFISQSIFQIRRR